MLQVGWTATQCRSHLMTHDSQDNKCSLSNTQWWVTLLLDVQQNGETSTVKLGFYILWTHTIYTSPTKTYIMLNFPRLRVSAYTQFLNYTLKLNLAFCYHFKYFQLEIIKKEIISVTISYFLYILQEPVSGAELSYSSAHNTWCRKMPTIHTRQWLPSIVIRTRGTVLSRRWRCRIFLVSSIHMYHVVWGGANKSLARPGRKKAAATKLGIYSTYSPRSSIHFLARCSNFCKPLKKNSEGCLLCVIMSTFYSFMTHMIIFCDNLSGIIKYSSCKGNESWKVRRKGIEPIKKSEVHMMMPYYQCCHHRCDTIQTDKNLLTFQNNTPIPSAQ